MKERDKDEFYELAQEYRHAKISNQDEVAAAYTNLIEFIDKLTLDARKFEEELYLKTSAENNRCLCALQEFVQEKIVPLDPVMVVGKLATIDKAIEYYFAQIELKRKASKDIIETCRKAFIELGATDMPRILEDALKRL